MGLSRGRGVQLGRFAGLLLAALVCAAAGHQLVRNRDGTTYCPRCRRLRTAGEHTEGNAMGLSRGHGVEMD